MVGWDNGTEGRMGGRVQALLLQINPCILITDADDLRMFLGAML